MYLRQTWCQQCMVPGHVRPVWAFMTVPGSGRHEVIIVGIRLKFEANPVKLFVMQLLTPQLLLDSVEFGIQTFLQVGYPVLKPLDLPGLGLQLLVAQRVEASTAGQESQ